MSAAAERSAPFHVLIPARLASSRLRNKPLADIGGQPMIVRVAERVRLSRAISCVVATDDEQILAACRDPVVSRAIACLHAQPSRHWTVEDLAADAGASRTVLGERFAKLLGAAPIEYLARLRMQLAAERLRSTTSAI